MRQFEDFDLTNYNSYHLHSVASRVFFPDSGTEIVDFFRGGSRTNTYVLGGGFNVILSREYYEDLDFVILRDNLKSVSFRENQVTVGAGLSLKTLSEECLQRSLSGLEVFYDIPGTVGGAIWMNAGAYGEEIKDTIEEVVYIDRQSAQEKRAAREEIKWDERISSFQSMNAVIVEARLGLKEGKRKEIEGKMFDILKKRNAVQPKEYPNAGSVFKRPPGHFVGKLVEDLGLKGFTIGGASISEKHAGFIVNRGNARASDILGLIDVTREEVQKHYGVELVLEQQIV